MTVTFEFEETIGVFVATVEKFFKSDHEVGRRALKRRWMLRVLSWRDWSTTWRRYGQ